MLKRFSLPWFRQQPFSPYSYTKKAYSQRIMSDAMESDRMGSRVLFMQIKNRIKKVSSLQIFFVWLTIYGLVVTDFLPVVTTHVYI